MSMIKILFEHISDNMNIYSSIIKTNKNGIASDMLKDAILKDVKNTLKKTSTKKNNIPTDIISIFYVSGVINVCLEYIREPFKFSTTEILEYLNFLIPNDIYNLIDN